MLDVLSRCLEKRKYNVQKLKYHIMKIEKSFFLKDTEDKQIANCNMCLQCKEKKYIILLHRDQHNNKHTDRLKLL